MYLARLACNSASRTRLEALYESCVIGQRPQPVRVRESVCRARECHKVNEGITTEVVRAQLQRSRSAYRRILDRRFVHQSKQWASSHVSHLSHHQQLISQHRPSLSLLGFCNNAHSHESPSIAPHTSHHLAEASPHTSLRIYIRREGLPLQNKPQQFGFSLRHTHDLRYAQLYVCEELAAACAAVIAT